MGYTEEEDKKSDFMALVDSLELVKEAVIRNDNDRAVKRIDYIFKEILNKELINTPQPSEVEIDGQILTSDEYQLLKSGLFLKSEQ